MSIELPVILSQSSGDPGRRELEEALVTKLMLDYGADVRLVSALDQIQPDSTDLLMLEGVSGQFAILSWLAPAEAHQALASLQISGRRAAHQGDSEASASDLSERKIYFVNLTDTPNVDLLISRIQSISRDRTTKTLQITGLNPRPSSSPPKQDSSAKGTNQVPQSIQSSIVEDQDLDQQQDDSLESLVDDLDALDL